MNNKILLTIAIPTYNRCDLLCLALNSVIDQITDGVEIIVSDNASTDNTEIIMKEYCTKHSIRYFRNPKNFGMDKNFLICLQKARGEYIQFLSDDDILLPGALKRILFLLETETPVYINLNSFTFSTKTFQLSEQKPPRISLRESHDLITYDKNLFIEYVGVYITYISATILKRSKFEQIKNPEQYFGTHFLHAHIVLNILADEKSKLIITKEPYLAAKNNNSGGFNLFDVWVKQYKKLLLQTAVKNGFKPKLMQRIYLSDMKGFIKDSIIKYRIEDNNYDMSNKWILFKYTYMYPSLWFKVWPYALLPKYILKQIYKQKKEETMKLSLPKKELKEYTLKQLETYFPDRHNQKSNDIDVAFEQALERTDYCFRHINNAAYSNNNGSSFFSHLHSDQYAQFLYFWANSLWKLSENKVMCDKLIYLNKTLHSFFISYKGNLPDIFFLTHPVGSVIGNACYNDFLVIGQNVTINTGEDPDGKVVPKLGKGLYLSAGAKIIGREPIGNRVSIGVDAFVYGQPIPDDSVVLRASDGRIIIRMRKKELCKAQQYFNVSI